MECRESLKVREFVLARLMGEPAGDGAAVLARARRRLRRVRGPRRRRWSPCGPVSTTTTRPISA